MIVFVDPNCPNIDSEWFYADECLLDVQGRIDLGKGCVPSRPSVVYGPTGKYRRRESDGMSARVYQRVSA